MCRQFPIRTRSFIFSCCHVSHLGDWTGLWARSTLYISPPSLPTHANAPSALHFLFASEISILLISSCVLNALQCCDILGINCIFSKNQLRADEQTGNDRGSKCLLGGTFHYDICTHIPQSAMAVWLPSVFVYSVSHYAELDCMLWPGMIHIAVFTGRNESWLAVEIEHQYTSPPLIEPIAILMKTIILILRYFLINMIMWLPWSLVPKSGFHKCNNC